MSWTIGITEQTDSGLRRWALHQCKKLLEKIIDALISSKNRFLIGGGRKRFSNWKSVTSGVLQESMLGPLLFLIHINHLCVDVMGAIRMMAQELVVYSDEDQIFCWAERRQVQCDAILEIEKNGTYIVNGRILSNADEQRILKSKWRISQCGNTSRQGGEESI